ncbi:MAG: hypothetical protein II961_07075 [Candidatus Riflebacteria bacterium]|nr:hypothetical protein [Candidatus Riflebacteria bacterium]
MKKGLLVIFTALLFVSCFAQNLYAATNNQLNRVVVTFSPLVIKNINCTNQLFNLFVELSKNKTKLSETIEDSGMLWSISQNYCGIQISFSSSKSLEELFTIVSMLLEKSFALSDKLLENQNNNNVKAIDRLYLFAVKPDAVAFKSNPVTIRFFDYLGKEVPDFYSKLFQKNEANEADNGDDSLLTDKKDLTDVIAKYCDFYKKCAETCSVRPNIQPVSKPILAKLLIWDNLTPDTFISASLVKNKLIFDGENNQNSGIELINTGNGMALVVFCETEKNSLYAQHLLMNKRIDAAVSGIGPKEWEAWNTKLLEVMRNDRRDFNKKAMFDAWNKHWSGKGFEAIPAKSDFKKPNYQKEVNIFATQSDHAFYLSPDTYPAIYACNDEDFKDGSNVAVCLEAKSNIINGIEKHVGSSLPISVPITINRKRPDRITLSFYSPEAKIPAHLSRIKSSVADFLYSKFKVTDLKQSIKIGIAGISSIPAYQLQGLLSLGWPTTKANAKIRVANISDLYDFVKNTSSNEKILKLRWENLASSPQDKAYILSVLACNNLTIDSWFGEDNK